ncbi:MAG TPA: lyase [Candidatus Binatia bacterium]|nr:lyase [Candidatus Binatia bacterium]
MSTEKQVSALAAAFFVVLAALAFASAAGELKVSIQEYEVPTAHSRPHDPAVAPDRSLWWTGQQANRLGRLDPATGAMREYPLRTPDSGPHGLTADREGNIWFTANYAGYIGKLDPNTGDVTEYRMPDPEAKDPHTPVFDQHSTLWFTVEESNFIGRLDPATGRIELKRVPTAHAVPYGIVISSNGTPWFCEFGTSKLASVDPKTMAITEHPLPQGARPRRLAITGSDVIYYSDYARGYLGQFDTRSGKQQEWPSPGGPHSEPYGIAITPDGAVWYSESGVHPNTLVRFDPRTQRFLLTAIPSGGGVVRNMAATRDGRLYLACSGVNKVAVVTP